MQTLNCRELVNTAHFCHSKKTGQPTGDRLASSSQGAMNPVCGCQKGEVFKLEHLHVNGVSALMQGDSRHQDNLFREDACK